MPALPSTRFRSSPHVALKRLGDLEPDQRDAFRDLESDPEFYGLFVAKPPLRMNVKSVTRPVAELFASLATPSRLDAPLDASNDEIVDLVLDGILEIESGEDFVCGADALAIVAPPPADIEPRDATARLSRDALLHAQDLVTDDAQALAMALYFYNHIPLSPFWRTRFATPEAVLAHLGDDAARLDRDWIASHNAPGWLAWISREHVARARSDATWKLYVSPRPEHVRDAFTIVARTLGAFPGTSFKIANDAAGMLRPDKLVAYFASREDLDDAAAILARELAGCNAQGVPFTAALDESGLLSWGVDPPDDAQALRWLYRTSWRLWLVQRLGAAMSIAKMARSATAVEPWLFAIARTQRHGVNVETWSLP
jgi:hypothetical protein